MNNQLGKVFNKQIHAEEFKLRILLTNTCTKSPRCSFCWNDFQPVPSSQSTEQYIDTRMAMLIILAYCKQVEGKYPLQIYFSGGEPTLHKDIVPLIQVAKVNGARVTLNTNGDFGKHLEDRMIGILDCIHFGVYNKDKALADKIRRMKGSVQCVYSKSNPYVDEDFIRFYLEQGLSIKVFGDLRENPSEYEAFAGYLKGKFPDKPLDFRFIGIQTNRGSGCFGCEKTCVTLKAAWVFPNGSIAACPQLEYKTIPGANMEELEKEINLAMEFHKVHRHGV